MRSVGRIGLLVTLALSLTITVAFVDQADAQKRRVPEPEPEPLVGPNQILATGAHVDRLVAGLMRRVDEYASRAMQLVVGEDEASLLREVLDDGGPEGTTPTASIIQRDIDRRGCRRLVNEAFDDCQIRFIDEGMDPKASVVCGYVKVIGTLNCDLAFLRDESVPLSTTGSKQFFFLGGPTLPSRPDSDIAN